MIEFGNTLRAAREAKGYTVAQIAETTHLAPASIEDLEREDFTRIPAPIYGRGFVKLYCEAVGLDPKPLVAEFMEIYNGNHDTTIRERPIAGAPKPETPAAPEPPIQKSPIPPPEPQPEPTPEPALTPKYETDLFGMQTTAAPEPPPAPKPKPVAVPEPPPPEPEPVTAPEPPPASKPEPIAAPKQEPLPTMDDLFGMPTAEPAHESPRLSRYAAPVSQSQVSDSSSSFLSPSLWRITILFCAAIVILWLGFLGLRSLYRATSTTGDVQPEPDDVKTTEQSEPAKPAAEKTPPPTVKPTADKTPPPAVTTKPVAQKPAKPAASTRTPQSIPALYID